MNFKDVMLAYGKLDRNLMAKGFFQGCLGFEFSGTRAADSARRIMGVARRALATRVCTTENLVSHSLRQLGAGSSNAQATWIPQVLSADRVQAVYSCSERCKERPSVACSGE